MTGTCQRDQIGAFSRMTPRSPTFWSPIAFSIPAGSRRSAAAGCRRAGGP